MKIGIMGGTFDPVHIGHVIAAERALEEAGLDEVWFMPSNVPPHKTPAGQVSADHRLEMVRKAVEEETKFRVTDFELKMGGISYTVNTVKLLKDRYPDYQFSWIIGGDMVKFLHQWYKIEEISQMIDFIGLMRPGVEFDPKNLPQRLAEKVRMIAMPMIEISSTEIRERRKAGKSIRYLVPHQVWRYIEEHALYES